MNQVGNSDELGRINPREAIDQGFQFRRRTAVTINSIVNHEQTARSEFVEYALRFINAYVKAGRKSDAIP